MKNLLEHGQRNTRKQTKRWKWSKTTGAHILCCACLVFMSTAYQVFGEKGKQVEEVKAHGTEAASVEDPALTHAYQALLELDDAATGEVDKWIRQANSSEDPANDPAVIALPGKIDQHLKSVQDAYDAFILKYPEHVGVRLAYASFLTDRGLEMKAAPHLLKATQLDPSNPAAWNNLGNHHGHMGPVRKAFECYEKAIALNPDASVYFHNFGTTVYLFRKDAMDYFDITEGEVFDKSLALYQVAFRKDPENFDLAEDIAQTYYGIRTKAAPFKMARPVEALEAWDLAFAIAPGEHEQQAVYIHRARILLGIDKLAEARAALDKVTLPAYQSLKKKISHNLDKRTAQHISGTGLR
jgi:tetratricopeptide (TPR) repeat protein